MYKVKMDTKAYFELKIESLYLRAEKALSIGDVDTWAVLYDIAAEYQDDLTYLISSISRSTSSEIISKRCHIFQNLKGQWVSRRSFAYTMDGLPNSAGYDDIYGADQQDLATAESYKWLVTPASKPKA